MGLFKRKKSRQEKVTATDIDAITDAAAHDDSGDILSSMADMPITEHLIELRRHLIKI